MFQSRKLARSGTFAMVWDEAKQRDVKKNDWEIELFGTGKQAVIPPSIHPDTGKPYTWGREIDFDTMDLGIGPVVPADLVASWGASVDVAESEEDDDDLFAIVKKAPLDLDDADITDIIENLPEDWPDDRDQWLTVGAALHHQFEGGDKGFTLWCDWSEKSEKYDESWSSYHQINREGVVKSTMPNVQLIVANDIRTASIVALNQFTQEVVLIRSPGTFKLRKASPKPVRQLDGDLWSSSHDYPVRAFMESPPRQGGYGI